MAWTTGFVWPRRTCRTWRVLASQMRTSFCAPASGSPRLDDPTTAARRVPSGPSEAQDTGPDQAAGVGLPEPHHLIVSPRGNQPPVGADGNRPDAALMGCFDRPQGRVALALQVVPFPAATVRRAFVERLLRAVGRVVVQLP